MWLPPLVTVWNYLAWTAGQVAGIVLVITTFTDLNGTAAVIVAYIIIVLFTLLGGFRAVVYTDSLQAVPFLWSWALLSLRYCCFTTTPEALAQTTSIDGFYKLFWQCARRNYDYLVAPGSRRFY